MMSADIDQDQEITPDMAEECRLKGEFFKLVMMNLHNFQRTFIINRRRRQQHMRSRRTKLCQFYIQNLIELETRVMEMIPIQAMAETWCKSVEEEVSSETEEKPAQQATCTVTKAHVPRYPRDTVRFYEDVVCTYSPEKWLETFRMSQRTFQALCAQLRDAMQPHGINAPLKNLISLETRCALALYAFATGADYRVIASLFRISRTSVCKFMKRFAEAVLEKLGPYLLAMPKDEEEYREIRHNFKRISNMPELCVGLLGVCEIHVSPHMDEVECYANNAGATTLVLQALVDDKLLFRKVSLETKRPNMMLEPQNDITKLGVRQINDHFMPCFAIAPDDYYTLRPWLMQSYAAPQAPHEHNFNNAIAGLQSMKEEAFRRLFGRWKILQRKGDLEPRTMVSIATACCALHNLLEEYDEGYCSQWTEGVDLTRFDVLTHCESLDETASDASAATLTEAIQIRDYLAYEMVSNSLTET